MQYIENQSSKDAMLNPKTVNTYGFVSIGIMTVMLVIIWAELVPRSMYLSLFLIAAALFLIRITLRLVLARQEREMRKNREESHKEGEVKE